MLTSASLLIAGPALGCSKRDPGRKAPAAKAAKAQSAQATKPAQDREPPTLQTDPEVAIAPLGATAATVRPPVARAPMPYVPSVSADDTTSPDDPGSSDVTTADGPAQDVADIDGEATAEPGDDGDDDGDATDEAGDTAHAGDSESDDDDDTDDGEED